MFHFLKTYCKKIYNHITEKFSVLFSKKQIDSTFFIELSDILLSSDVGVPTTKLIMQQLKDRVEKTPNIDGAMLKKELMQILENILVSVKQPAVEATVFVCVGINGSGKTTFVSKLAHQFLSQNKKVLCVAADTFRAAATDQLDSWAKKTGFDIVHGKPQQDPASVVFDACEKFIREQYDILIIDTAGRLQTKTNLMAELSKLKRIVEKKLTNYQIATLLVLDAMLGQNSLLQAKLFQEATAVSGVVLTKLDGTGKGGFIFAIAQELKLPVLYVSFGEKVEELSVFDHKTFITDLLTL